MDPNEIVGKPTEREVWLAPDWSNYVAATKPQPSGWTKVSVRDTTYKDGRIVTQVLDENRKPITTQNLDTQTDPETRKAWDAAQDDRKPPGGITTRTINGAVFQWNPETRAYDIPTGSAPAGTQTPQQIREEAERAKNAGLAPGLDPRSETDAERAKRADETIKAQGAAARQAEIDRQAAANTAHDNAVQDATRAQSAAQANKPGAPTLSPDGKGGTIAVQTMPDGTIKTTPLPNVPSNAQEITVDNRRYRLNPSTGKYDDVTPERPTSETAVPAGLPDFKGEYGNITAELAAYQKQLQDAVALPDGNPNKITPVRADQLMKARYDLANARVSELNTQAERAMEVWKQQATLRGQDINEAQSRRSNASTDATAADKVAADVADLGYAKGAKGPDDLATRSRMAELAFRAMVGGAQGGFNAPPAPPMPASVAPYLTLPGVGTFAIHAAAAPGQTPGAAPNALGLGAVGVPGATPVQPPASVAAPAAPADAEAQRQQQAAASAAQGDFPADYGGNTFMPVNPPAGSGNDPTQPVGIAPIDTHEQMLAARYPDAFTPDVLLAGRQQFMQGLNPQAA